MIYLLIALDSLIGAAGTGWGLTMASLSANTVGYTKKATANAVQIIGKSVSILVRSRTNKQPTVQETGSDLKLSKPKRHLAIELAK
jgi:hypothetical protein